MAAIPKVLRSVYLHKVNSSLLNYINMILSFMYQIPSYSDMAPYVDDLKLQADELTKAIAKANTGDKAAIRERNEVSDKAMAALNTLAGHMDVYKDRTVNYILGAGFKCQDSSPVKEAVPPIAPIITRLNLVASCTVKVFYEVDSHAVVVTNWIQYSLDGIEWIDVGDVSRGKTATISHLPKLKTIYFRVRSIGAKKMGPWSEVSQIDVV